MSPLRFRTFLVQRFGLLCLLVGAALAFAATWAWACGDDPPPPLTGRYTVGAGGVAPTPETLAAMGRRIFMDTSLSASGQQSCASCHDPAHAYGPPNALAVQPGGVAGDRHGYRAAPTLRYLHGPFAFTQHYIDEFDNHGADSGPAGGRTWDGRVDGAREQALMPLLDRDEMGNADTAEIVGRLRHSAYAADFDAAFSPPGTHVLDNAEAVIAWLTTSLAYFEQAEEFHPFTSRYDAYLRGELHLTASEERGRKLFNDPERGNCASCHPSAATSSTVIYPRFTDFEFSALGVPRNRSLPANRDPGFNDLGLCGPRRSDLTDRADYCGAFRAPGLRNVATRQRYFHNGGFTSLRAVVDFYVTRDTAPARWYPRGRDGKVQKFDDLPPAYRANVKTDAAPFLPFPDGRPRLSPGDIDDVVAFLRSLTDADAVVPPVGRSAAGPGARRAGSGVTAKHEAAGPAAHHAAAGPAAEHAAADPAAHHAAASPATVADPTLSHPPT